MMYVLKATTYVQAYGEVMAERDRRTERGGVPGKHRPLKSLNILNRMLLGIAVEYVHTILGSALFAGGCGEHTPNVA